MTADQIRSIQILALESIEDQSYEAFFRQVARWYSKTFSTPLQTVMLDIPEHEVLMTYYEDMFEQALENASKNDQLLDVWKSLRSRVLSDPNKVEQEMVQREVDDDKWWAQEIQKEVEKAAKAAAQLAAKQAAQQSKQPNIQEKDPLENLQVRGESESRPEE